MSNLSYFEAQKIAELGYIPAAERREYALGVDLGQAHDFTALSVIEKLTKPIPIELDGSLGKDSRQLSYAPVYNVRHLERIPLQTSYVQVVRRVADVLTHPNLRGRCELVIDKSGVGRAVADLFSEGGLPYVGVTITGGLEESKEPGSTGGWRVPKAVLISTLQAAFHRGDFKIAPTLAEADTLVKELADFRVKLSESSSYVGFEARQGAYDDLLLSVAIALWRLTPKRGGRAVNVPLRF
jgi:hypothetical protein